MTERIAMRILTRVGYWSVVVALLILACNADRAYAGTYVMRSCNVPGHPSAPAAPWSWVHTQNTYAHDDCARGGGFGLDAGPMQRATAAAVVLEAPTAGPESAITIRRVRLWMIARLSGSGSALFVAMSSGGATGATHDYPFGPPGGDTLSQPYVSPVLLADTKSYVIVLSCSGSAPEGCTPASVNPLEIRGAEVTLHEDVPPSGTITGGTLFGAGEQTGSRRLDYSVTDAESGVAQVSAMVGSTEVATQNFASECRYSGFAACPRSRSGSLMIDTRRVPDGAYPVSIRVTDAAGNRETVQAPDALEVINQSVGQARAPNGTHASADARLAVSFVGRRGSTATVSYDRSVTIRGRLTTASGTPIARAAVDVAHTIALQRPRTINDRVITGADGAFTYRIGRHASSRSVTFRYRPTIGDGSFAATQRLRLKVPAVGRLRVALRGVQVTYSGRIVTRPIPSRGKLVHLQGRAVGGAWTTFAVRRTSGSGRFRGRYRLRVRRPGVRLQFRLRIPSEHNYPYVAGVGRAVTRRVR